MNAWVTGANGFIGRHLVRVLADRGYRVHGIGHGAISDAERHRLGLVHWLNGEIDAANLNALAAHSGLPSTIFHLAGGSSVGLSIAQPFEDFSRTVESTARLLEWLRGTARDCRVIAASSAAVYGAGHEGAIAVDAVTLPMSPYGQHKLMMEQLCRSYAVTFGLRSTVVRLFSVYGQNLRKQLPWDICCRLQAGERNLMLGGTGAEVRDWTDVRDVARLLTAIDGKPQSEAFQVINAGSGLGTTVARVAARIAECWGGTVSVQYSGVVRAGDPTSLLSDDAMRHTLPFDWKIPVEQGLADYVSWFKDQIR
ncbi:SDR family oxidoreductase [Bradyrhizobium sp. WSM 1738]|uniref:NAD-dependent epimerase/dehydratase family protein n=1 Tax=Bradyrhizobium hereditatis TaxID=2821405 RepID=UPI001CE2EB22|nr:SDR family oxidoreductase [Bradyrhizobium hereditatis]MCA6117809.1 SDR family oxidoreductase [Bradyrhizobium hereditatis]